MLDPEISIRKRIAKTKKAFKWTENSIAGDSATQKRLNRQLSHGATITLDTLLLILKASPGLSADWLLLGEGDMMRSTEMTQNPGASTTKDIFQNMNGEHLDCHNDTDIIQRFLSLLEEKDTQINRLITLLSK